VSHLDTRKRAKQEDDANENNKRPREDETALMYAEQRINPFFSKNVAGATRLSIPIYNRFIYFFELVGQRHYVAVVDRPDHTMPLAPRLVLVGLLLSLTMWSRD
jgi:hypothetical protein